MSPEEAVTYGLIDRVIERREQLEENENPKPTPPTEPVDRLAKFYNQAAS